MELKIDELITEEDFVNKKLEYKKRELELKSIIEELELKNDSVVTSVAELLRFGQLAADAFQKATLEEKRIILSSIGSNLHKY